MQQLNDTIDRIRNSQDIEKKRILLLLEKKEFSKAETALDSLLAKKKSSYAEDLFEIAELYLPLNQEKSDHCHALAAKTGDKNPELLNKYAIYLMNTGKLNEAHSVFEKLLAMSNCNDKVRELALGNRGVLYKNQGKWQEAIDCLNQAQVLSIRNDSKIIETSNLNNLGACYSNAGDLDQAGHYLLLALEKISNLLDQSLSDTHIAKLKSIQANALSNLAINKKRLYLKTERAELLDEAEQHLERAIDIDQSSGNKSVLIRHHGNLANIYKLKNQHEKRRKHLEKSRELSVDHGTLKDKLTVQVNLALILHEEGDAAEALQAYKSCLDNENIYNFRQLTANALWGLADVHKTLREEKQANDCAAHAKKLFSELGYTEQVRHIQENFPLC